MPAIAPSPGPMKKIRLIGVLTLMPSSRAVCMFSDTARILIPIVVAFTNQARPSQRDGEDDDEDLIERDNCAEDVEGDRRYQGREWQRPAV